MSPSLKSRIVLRKPLCSATSRDPAAGERRLAVYQAVYPASKDTTIQVNEGRAVFLSLLELGAGHETNRSLEQWLSSAIERLHHRDYAIEISEKP
jgi:hypothetical protein